MLGESCISSEDSQSPFYPFFPLPDVAQGASECSKPAASSLWFSRHRPSILDGQFLPFNSLEP